MVLPGMKNCPLMVRERQKSDKGGGGFGGEVNGKTESVVKWKRGYKQKIRKASDEEEGKDEEEGCLRVPFVISVTQAHTIAVASCAAVA